MRRLWNVIGTVVGVGGAVLPTLEPLADAHPGTRTGLALAGAVVALLVNLRAAFGPRPER